MIDARASKVASAGVTIQKRGPKMASCFFECKLEGCPFFAKVQYVEKNFFKKHLVLNHGFDNLLQFAFTKGIISDPYRCPSLQFVINKITEISRVSRK